MPSHCQITVIERWEFNVGCLYRVYQYKSNAEPNKQPATPKCRKKYEIRS